MSHKQSALENEIDRVSSILGDHENQLEAFAILVASIRNEINNPLAALLGQTQLLLREDLSEKSRRRAQVIESQAQRIEKIVSQLRDIRFVSTRAGLPTSTSCQKSPSGSQTRS